MTAADAFKAIDAPTQGVIVPYLNNGRDLIAQLCASHDPTQQFDLLREAQHYSVNVFQQTFQALEKDGAIAEIAPGARIFHLRPEYYSTEFGLSETPIAPQETLYA